jgi:hypothetical protein
MNKVYIPVNLRYEDISIIDGGKHIMYTTWSESQKAFYKHFLIHVPYVVKGERIDLYVKDQLARLSLINRLDLTEFRELVLRFLQSLTYGEGVLMSDRIYCYQHFKDKLESLPKHLQKHSLEMHLHSKDEQIRNYASIYVKEVKHA